MLYFREGRGCVWRNNTDLLRPLISQFLDNQEYRTHREHHLCLFQLQVSMAAGSCHSLSSWGSMLLAAGGSPGFKSVKEKIIWKEIIMGLQKGNTIKKNTFLVVQSNALHPPAFLSVSESYTSLSCNSVHLYRLINNSNYIIAGTPGGQVSKILPVLLWY